MRDSGKKYGRTFKTRALIMKAFIGLGKDRDIDRITVKSVTQAAGISRSTFYEYFFDTNEVIQYIENILISEMPVTPKKQALSRVTMPTLEECRNVEWERAWFCYYREYGEALNVLLGPHGDEQFAGKFRRHLMDQLDMQMYQNGFPNDSLRKYFRQICSDVLIALAREWTAKESALDLEALTTISSVIRIGSQYLSALYDEEKKERGPGR